MVQMFRFNLVTYIFALLVTTFMIPTMAAEMSEAKRELLIANYIYRSVISRLSVEDNSDGMDFFSFENIDWFCMGDHCIKKNGKIVTKNVQRLYKVVDRYMINCEDDLEGLRSKLDSYASNGLSELEVNSVGDHQNFFTTNKLFQLINRVTNSRSGEYHRTSMELERYLNRSGKVLVSCDALATVLSSSNPIVKKAKEQGVACQPYDRLKICLGEFAEVSQDIYHKKLKYREEKGYELIDLHEPYKFMTWLKTKNEQGHNSDNQGLLKNN